jgi:hypothetical protein
LFFHSDLNLFLDDKVGVFISYNGLGNTVSLHEPRALIMNAFADRYFPNASKDAVFEPVNAAPDARKVAGVFAISRRSESNFTAFANLLSTVDIVANDDGSIILGGADGDHYVHIGPMLWKSKNSKELLAAKTENGVVTQISLNSIAPYITFEKLPNWRSGKIFSYMLAAALGILFLAAMSWPIAAVVRRYHKARFPYVSSSARAYRLSRALALTAIVVVVTWFVIANGTQNDLTFPSDATLLTLQWATLLAFSGLVLAALWNLYLVWRDKRSWLFKFNSVILALSALVLWSFSYAGGLFSMSTNY